MKLGTPTKNAAWPLLAVGLLVLSAKIYGHPSPQSPPNIGVSGHLSVDKVERGRTVQAVVEMDIPSGFHVNSNRPLEKFLIATQLQIQAPLGVRVGTVVYPRPVLRNLKFSKNRVSVFEGHTIMRVNVTVPANFGPSSTELKAQLRYQSCNDDFCFPPQTREVTFPIAVVGTRTTGSRMNGR